MRTTFTIDDELLAEYKRLAADSHRSLSDVVQDALREALARRREREGRPPVELPVFRGTGGVLPGVDLSSNAALSELLEAGSDRVVGDAARRGARHDAGAAGEDGP